ncbi:hypothetical protein EUU23_05705 [Sphingorhabdus sp. IMCC26285]|jgi:hypothetical protein|uniref:Uncharacterized protein n=1 Tax=Sphingorhabdus profundilacus TaxID=2509718 RepID=A0A6I4M3V9_9SPHN|nr:hypothetical protein [Sphingorhabdus profundilacus]MVZ97198.1 hypothetical protein [Sphingorhabdus profundilacus]
MLMDFNLIAAETRSVEYQQHDVDLVMPIKPTQELRTFALPKSVWATMFLAYAIFFGALIMVTGHDKSALFMIAISACYTLMYFGTAAAMNTVGAPGRPATVYGDIDTFTGQLGKAAAFAQILIVPIMVAFFGVVIALIWVSVTP